MARMNIKQNVKLHNKHHFVLTDAKTGKIKQEGWAYNAILNQGFSRIVGNHFKGINTGAANNIFGISTTAGVFGKTFIGLGVTAVSATDTAMSSYLDRKTNVHHAREKNVAGGYASHTRKAVWSEIEHQNTAITEVGLGVDNQTSGLCTRALIKDSEGNQITINKGTTDILTVYSTVYIELSQLYGSNFGFVEGASGNALLDWVYGNTHPSNPAIRIYMGSNKAAINSSDEAVKTSLVYHSFPYNDSDLNYDTVNKRVVISSNGTGGSARFTAAEANAVSGIWEIGATISFYDADSEFSVSWNPKPIFRAVMPISGVWPGTTITDEELGTGDSATTVFQTTWAPVLSGTDVVKVNGVTKTKGTDYTIDLATGEITFATAPALGLAVTCTYGIEQIPKDSNHVLDIGFTIQFADGSV